MADWFCPSLMVPEYERDLIHEWTLDQRWPLDTKFKDPETYHITILYSRVPHTSKRADLFMYEMNMDNWEYSVRVNGVRKLIPGREGAHEPIALTLHGALLDFAVNHYFARARSLGLEPVEHPFVPHITVAEVPVVSNFDPATELELPGPDSALGYPLKFSTPSKPTELHTFYEQRKAAA
jgi:hypothetical protein